MILLDPSVAAEAHVQDRLDREPVLWLGTVSERGRPHTVPVWFAWIDPTVTIFSQPDTAKVAHLRVRTGASLALDTTSHGADVVLGEGEAALVSRDDVSDVLPVFAAKYRPMLGGQALRRVAGDIFATDRGDRRPPRRVDRDARLMILCVIWPYYAVIGLYRLVLGAGQVAGEVRADIARMRAGASFWEVLRSDPRAREQEQARATIAARSGEITGARRPQGRR